MMFRFERHIKLPQQGFGGPALLPGLDLVYPPKPTEVGFAPSGGAEAGIGGGARWLSVPAPAGTRQTMGGAGASDKRAEFRRSMLPGACRSIAHARLDHRQFVLDAHAGSGQAGYRSVR